MNVIVCSAAMFSLCRHDKTETASVWVQKMVWKRHFQVFYFQHMEGKCLVLEGTSCGEPALLLTPSSPMHLRSAVSALEVTAGTELRMPSRRRSSGSCIFDRRKVWSGSLKQVPKSWTTHELSPRCCRLGFGNQVVPLKANKSNRSDAFVMVESPTSCLSVGLKNHDCYLTIELNFCFIYSIFVIFFRKQFILNCHHCAYSRFWSFNNVFFLNGTPPHPPPPLRPLFQV